MKYPVTYRYKIGDGRYYSSADPDHDLLYEDISTFFKENSIQHRFVDKHNRRGVSKDHPNYALFKICIETLYFYREQDRNFFLLKFGELYEAANT